jgi:dipeptidyl aminopeptidase/acylaminoacyl peptidase
LPRPARPDDQYRIQVPSDPRLSPDGRLVAFVVKASSSANDGYRQAIWAASTDGSSPARRLTLGMRNDRHPRFSPDGQVLAFLSDRRLYTEDEPDRPRKTREREDCDQVYLLPLDGGEARRLTDLPRGVTSFAWSPDSRTMAILTSSLGATAAEEARRRRRPARPRPGQTPLSDFRYLDRLGYQSNGIGFVDDRELHLWLVDVETGRARPLVMGSSPETDPAWSPDGTRIAFAANRHRDPDIDHRSSLFVVDVADGEVHPIAGGPDAHFDTPTWSPDGRWILALGDRMPRAEYRTGIWRFAADGSDAGPGEGTDLLADSELMPNASMNSDVTLNERARLVLGADGTSVMFAAPIQGSVELWRVPIDAGTAPLQLTAGRHYLSGWDAVGAAGGGQLVAAIRSAPTLLPEVVAIEPVRRPRAGRTGEPRPLSSLNATLSAEIEWVEAHDRRWSSDGREIQGWLLPAGIGRQPLVLEIHGGPHTLYGWAPMLEWQVLAGAGMSVLAANPRGSEGYGEAFNRANLGDWGDGPMADLMAGVDAVIEDGVADPDRLGVTGGSYGGYLTNWIVGRTQRFRAAMTCRSVADMRLLFLTGDISGGEWASLEFGRKPWDDPAYFERISPISLAANIRTPLLIQHAEQDIRTTVGQAEALFTVLRSHRRPVRFMRVPRETHELTRSGTPYRRVEHLVQVRDWFVHFLVRGEHRLPPPPRNRAGR